MSSPSGRTSVGHEGPPGVFTWLVGTFWVRDFGSQQPAYILTDCTRPLLTEQILSIIQGFQSDSSHVHKELMVGYMYVVIDPKVRTKEPL